MPFVPKARTSEELRREVEMAVMKSEDELRDRFANSAMVAAIAADCAFLQSSESTRGAGRRFYELAQSMIEARRAIRL